MPTKKIVNYVPTVKKIMAHWTLVEAAIGEELVVPEETTHDDAGDTAGLIEDAEAELIDARNALSRAQGERNRTRSAAHEAAKQARKSLRGLAKNVPDVLGLPNLPGVTTAPASLLALYTDIANVWKRVNALPQASVPAAKLPLTIPLTENKILVQLTQAQFVARIAALTTATENLAAAEAAVSTVISQRDRYYGYARELVKDYAGAVRGLLPSDHALLKTIPTLSGG